MSLRRVSIYVVFLVASVGLLFMAFRSWTGSLYFYINPMLIPIYFLLTAFLLYILISGDTMLTSNDKLVLIILHAFTTLLLSTIVMYPGVSGDNWYHLGRTKTVDIFGQHYSTVFVYPGEEYLENIIGKTYVLARGITQSMLVVTFSRILSVDLYWVHILYMNVLWSFFVPILTFRISKAIGGSNRVNLLASFLTATAPILIGWSWMPVPNSLGFLSFLVVVYLLIKSLSSNMNLRHILLLLITIFFVVITHDMTGITSISIILLAFALKSSERLQHTSQFATPFLVALGFLVAVIFLPAMAVIMQYVYPIVSNFSLQKMLALDIYHIIFAEFADYSLVQALTNGALLVLGVIGVILYKEKSENKLPTRLLILTFIALIVQHRLYYYFIEDPPFGVHRLYTFMPFVAGPLAAITIDALLSSRFVVLQQPARSLVAKTKSIMPKLGLKKTFLMLLVCAGLAGIAAEGVLITWTSIAAYGSLAIMSVSSIDAAELLHEEYLRTNEKYVVVSDPLTESAGAAVVGYRNYNELFLPFALNRQLYLTAITESSITPLLEAASYNNASVSYLVVSKWSLERYIGKSIDFYAVSNLLSLIIEPFATPIGNDEKEIHIFRLKLPLISREGIGPSISVFMDSEMVLVNSTYAYDIVTDVSYTLTLSGHTTYNITNWPLHWSYEEISPIPMTRSINANSWINFTATAQATYDVTWSANEIYKDVMWRDDSLLDGWYFYTGDPEHAFTSDGDIATESLGGEVKYYVNYEKALPALQNASVLLVRAKGSDNSRFAIEIWDDSEGKKTNVFWSSWNNAPEDYKTFTFSLPRDKTFHRLRLFAMTTDSSPATVYWDYVIITR